MAALSAHSSLTVQEGTQRYSQALPNLERLSSVFADYPEIQAVYPFGSTSTGRTHAESDLDLAIVLRPDGHSFPKLNILAKLAQAGFCNVDLVTLDTNDIVLKHEAVRRNRLIYQSNDFDLQLKRLSI